VFVILKKLSVMPSCTLYRGPKVVLVIFATKEAGEVEAVRLL